MKTIFLLLFCGLTAACSTLPRKAVPLHQLSQAEISGIPGARVWADEVSGVFEDDLLSSVEQGLNHNAIHTNGIKSTVLPTVNVLSLSGGGGYGAFGAGVLNGWSRSGLRPEFKMVTGISTGALIAPFAFIGPEYDQQLKLAFTTVSAKDIYITRWLSFLWSDAVVDSLPLSNLIKRFITDEVMQGVAKAHREGRRLYIGTTNLDADRLVIWNMGLIANSGDPQALDLFRQIILASSSVPGAFPPVMIKVKVDGISYDEMHVDGGIKAQFFLLAATMNLADFRKKLDKLDDAAASSRIYVIRNAEIGPEPEQVARNLADISERSLFSLIKAQALNDLSRLYEFSQQNNLEFNWLALPAEFESSKQEEFNKAEMNKLYNIGYSLGLKKNVWQNTPPVNGSQSR